MAAGAVGKVAAGRAEERVAAAAREAELAAAADKGAVWQAGRITVTGTGTENGTALQELERANALFTGLGLLWEPLRAEGEAALSFEGVPLHEGARRAYKGLGFIA